MVVGRWGIGLDLGGSETQPAGADGLYVGSGTLLDGAIFAYVIGNAYG